MEIIKTNNKVTESHHVDGQYRFVHTENIQSMEVGSVDFNLIKYDFHDKKDNKTIKNCNPARMEIKYINYSSDHWHANEEIICDFSKEEAKSLIEILTNFINS